MSGVTLADVRPGDLIFGPIGGIVPGWFPVAVGQALLADRKARLTWKRWRKIRHVLVCTGDGKAVQAMPRGAEEIELTAARHWTKEYVYLRPAYGAAQSFRGADGQKDLVALRACSYVGTPYGFLTYGALAVEHVLPGRQEWLSRYISSRKEMICSQLADQALSDAGLHVFDDGRLPQDVVPAELFRALIDRPGTRYTFAGKLEWSDVSHWS